MEAFETLIRGSGFASLSWQNLVMFVIGGVLIFLAIRKNYEPLLLIPIGLGAILANLPLAMLGATSEGAAACTPGFTRCCRWSTTRGSRPSFFRR